MRRRDTVDLSAGDVVMIDHRQQRPDLRLTEANLSTAFDEVQALQLHIVVQPIPTL